MDDKKKASTVPYLSAAKMDKLLQLVSERSLNNISASYFKSYGFGDADAYLAMNTLRFLGLIDENDKPTEYARKFQLRGETRNKEVEPIIKSAYSTLFESVADPHKLEKDELSNEFMHGYSLSNRVARSAVPAFLKLCEFAGLLEEGSVTTRVRQTKQSTPKTSSKGKQVKAPETLDETPGHDSTVTTVPFANGKIKLLLPTDILTQAIFEGELNEDIKKLTGAINAFSKKHIEIPKTNTGTGTEDTDSSESE